MGESRKKFWVNHAREGPRRRLKVFGTISVSRQHCGTLSPAKQIKDGSKYGGWSDSRPALRRTDRLHLPSRGATHRHLRGDGDLQVPTHHPSPCLRLRPSASASVSHPVCVLISFSASVSHPACVSTSVSHPPSCSIHHQKRIKTSPLLLNPIHPLSAPMHRSPTSMLLQQHRSHARSPTQHAEH